MNEAKTVTFGGDASPAFGWCVISVGGPDDGQSEAFQEKVQVSLKEFDPDKLKLFTYHDSDFDDEYIRLEATGEKFYAYQHGIDPPYTLRNPELVSKVLEITRPQREALKEQLLAGETQDADRLPNLLLKMKDFNAEDITPIAATAKGMGYKVGIVWEASGLKIAYHRMVAYDSFFSFLVNGVVEQADDFWVLSDTNSVNDNESDGHDAAETSKAFRVESTRELASFDIQSLYTAKG